MHPNRLEGIIVPPLSKIKIAELTDSIRTGLEIDQPYLPIMEIYEVLDVFLDGARFEVLFKDQMGADHGRTLPDERVIYIREDVYEGAYHGQARDRFTLCHELGHLLMHRGIALSRIDPLNPPPIYKNSEWQADVFASQLLMPRALLKQYSDAAAVVKDFGVSYEAAWVREEEYMRKKFGK